MGTQTNGMLFVASGIGAEDEAEFNEWYDHEHVEERARIEGFISAARYRSLSGGKPYLGLYRTQSLDAFTSPAYKAAFGKQTQWSVTNLARMVDPMRRVAAVEAVVGQGSGSFIAVLSMTAGEDPASLRARVTELGLSLAKQPGVIQSYLLSPDTVLSSPLPAESTANRVMFPMTVIEASSREAIDRAIASARAFFAASVSDVAIYALLWKLYSAEIPAA